MLEIKKEPGVTDYLSGAMDDFDSLIVTLNSVQDPKQFISLLRDLTRSHRILRIKGFIDIPEKSMRSVIQAVGPRIETYFDRPWKSDEKRAGTHFAVLC